MSNAAVINATATLGRAVGSLITIVTDGSVTLKAYGKGPGAWSATLAFAPVVNGVTGSPVTLTISNNQPSNVAQSILTDATSWVGWVVSSVGEFEATGIVEGVTGSDSLSGFLGIYKDDASAPKYAIEADSTAMVAGVQVVWNGMGWMAVGGSARQLKTIASIKPSSNTAVPEPAAIAADTTIARVHNIPFSTKTFSVLLENYGASPLVYDNVSVKVGGNGTTQGTAVRLTKDGNTTITIPAAITPSTAVTDAKYAVPSVVELDMQIVSYINSKTSPTPDTTMPVTVWLRMHTTSGGTFQKTNALNIDPNIPDTAGTIAGDKVSTWDSTVITYSPLNAISVSAVRVRTDKPTITTLLIGDSHMTGNGFPEQFQPLLMADFPGVNFAYFKQTVGGVGTTIMARFLKQYLPILKPDIVYIPGTSVNDGSGAVVESRTRSMEMLNDCLDAGCVVVTSNQTPSDGSAGNAIWLGRVNENNAEIAAQNLYWFDQWADCADPLTGGFLPGISSDGTHFSAAGLNITRPRAYAAFKAAVESLVA